MPPAGQRLLTLMGMSHQTLTMPAPGFLIVQCLSGRRPAHASSLCSYWLWARMAYVVSLWGRLPRPDSGTLPRWDNAHMVNFLNGFPVHLIYILLFFLLLLCGIGFPMAEELVLLAGGVLVASGVLHPLLMFLAT